MQVQTLGEPIWNLTKTNFFSTMKLLYTILMLKIMKIFNSKGDWKNYGNFKRRIIPMTSTMAILQRWVSWMMMNSSWNFDILHFNVKITFSIPFYSFCHGICHIVESCSYQSSQALVNNLLPTFVCSTHPIVFQVVAQVFVHLLQFIVYY
jgi:hypothetical protein